VSNLIAASARQEDFCSNEDIVDGRSRPPVRVVTSREVRHPSDALHRTKQVAITPSFLRFKYAETIAKLPELRGLASYLLVWLADKAGAKGRAWWRISTIAAELNVSERQIIRCLRAAERAGQLQTIRRSRGKGNTYLFPWDRLFGQPEACAMAALKAEHERQFGLRKHRSTKPAIQPGDVGVAVEVTSKSCDEVTQMSPQAPSHHCLLKTLKTEPSSSSRQPADVRKDEPENRTTTDRVRPAQPTPEQSSKERTVCLAENVQQWAEARQIALRNPDRTIGPPTPQIAVEWASIVQRAGLIEPEEMFAACDLAWAEARRITRGSVRNWRYLTEQIADAAPRIAARVIPFRRSPAGQKSASEPEMAYQPDPVQQEDNKGFGAWWSRLPHDRRKQYGGPCSEQAMADFRADRDRRIRFTLPKVFDRPSTLTGE
jgi:hypothetical protein